MQLSIIIVNYRVRFFLEQCLHSVARAIKGVEAEVWVVDNNSEDDSVAYLSALFPWVKMLPLSENMGFAKANNLGLQQATGKYVLFLNPDTLVAEDAFITSLQLMEQQPEVGALGIKMLDGTGRYLKESKRGLPTPLTSFYKLTGLAALFPHSRVFARYYLGHLPADKNAEVEVLAGAYMMLRQSLLNDIGGFDERFFMYGEDIDLSYRVGQAGMKNFYLATSSILHFKGESTKKGTLNYVRIFYQAMALFVQKHYQGVGAGAFRILLQVAIAVRAMLAAMNGIFKRVGLPLLDTAILFGCLWMAMQVWYTYIKPGVHLESAIRQITYPAFAVLFLITAALWGLYDPGFRPRKVLGASLAAALVVLACYSLLPEQFRFSRGIMVVAGLLSAAAMLLWRWLLVKLHWLEAEDELSFYKQTAVAGTCADYAEVEQLMKLSGNDSRLLGRLDVEEDAMNAMGPVHQLKSALRRVSFRDLVLVISPELPAEKALAIMQHNPGLLRYKFYYRGSQSLVGSDSKERSGEVFSATSHFHLAMHSYRRSKRLFDWVSSFLLLMLAPVCVFFQPSPTMYVQQVWAVFCGRKTWVGYGRNQAALPPLKEAVLRVDGSRPSSTYAHSSEVLLAMELRYAASYFWTQDLRLLCSHFGAIGKA